MKKQIIILVMMCLSVSVSAQKDNMYAVKQAGLNALKRSLVAPSQFILTDYNGNRISVNGIEVISHNKGISSTEWTDSTYFYSGNKWTFRHHIDDEEPDSIWVYKMVQEPTHSYYVVRIIGDARNRAGGYAQIIEDVYVYGKGNGFFGTMNQLKPETKRYHINTIVCEKKEKTVEETEQTVVDGVEKQLEAEHHQQHLYHIPLYSRLIERNIDLEYVVIGENMQNKKRKGKSEIVDDMYYSK